jgi:sulfur-carrier protein adenylyltransferase/sulfurtransferase
LSQAFTQDEKKRYSRQLILPEIGLEGQNRLKNASVLIIGIGGLGSAASLYLAAAGIGRIGLVDRDVVDISNLQRQIIHDSQHIGIPKVESARERLLALNPSIIVDACNESFDENTADFIAGNFDILLDCSDNFQTRYLINDYCVRSNKAEVFGAVFRFEGQISVFDARVGSCYRCVFPNPLPVKLVQDSSEIGIFSPLPGVIGTLMAVETIKLVVGIGSSLIGHFLTYDALEAVFQSIAIPKNPNCPACGKNPKINQ